MSKLINESRVEYEGAEYEAIHRDGCKGCDFLGTKGCTLHPGKCSALHREDGQSVIWIKVE